MTAEINELFEEGITRSNALTDTADEAMNAIDTLVKGAESLTGHVEEEGHEISQHLRDLASRLDHAEDELDGSRGQAESALEGLAGKAADLKTEVGELLDRVKKSLAELDSHHDRIEDSLTSQMSSTQTDFTELAQKTHDLETEADRHLNEAGAALTAFRSAIDAARTELAHKKEEWATAMGHLETHAHEQADAWMAGMHGLLARQATAMVEAANGVVEHHNEAMDTLRHRFIEQAPQELTSALEPLQTAFGNLKDEAAGRQQTLAAHAQQVGQAATEAVSLLETVKADLASAGQLG